MKFPAISPFKLLKPYEQTDAKLFFGRDNETRSLANALRQTKFILLYGASGTGKTSLIRCGLQGMFSPRDWMPVFVRRGAEGFPAAIREAIAVRYTEYYRLMNPGQESPATDHLTLRELIKALFNITFIPVYLILDQFEEVFTLGTEDEQSAFFEEVAQLRLFQEDLFCKLLISTREEYIAHFYKYENKLPFLFEHRFRVEKMREEQLVEVVEKTLAVEYPDGVRFQTGEGVPLQIVHNLTDVRGEVDLTTLQVYLDRLYREDLERLNDAETRDYLLFDKELVGDNKIEHVLSDFLDEQLRAVNNRLRVQYATEMQQPGNIALQVLYSLVTDQGTKRSRTAAESFEIINGKRFVSASLPLVQACFSGLSSPECRILNPLASSKTGEKYYEVTHDRLAEQVFRKITQEEVRYREALTTLSNKLKLHLAALKSGQKPEFLSLGEIELIEQSLKTDQLAAAQQAFFKESKNYHVGIRRRQRRLTIGAFIAALVFLGVALFAGYQWSVAQKRRQAGEWVSGALLMARTDATAAMDTVERALDLLPDYSSAMVAKADIYSNNEFYERSFVHPAAVKGVVMATATNGDIFSWTDTQLFHWARNGILKDSMTIKYISSAALSPDGSTLAVGNQVGEVLFLETGSFRNFKKYSVNPDSDLVKLLVFAGNKICFAATRDKIYWVDREKKGVKDVAEALLDETTNKPNTYTALFYDLTKKTLLAGHRNGLSEELDIKGRLLRSFKGHSDQVLAFAASPDGKILVSAGRDALLCYWDAQRKPLLRVNAHNSRINALSWSPDSSRLLTASKDYQIKSWSPEGNLIAVYRGHSSFVNGISISFDGRYFASAGEDKVVRLWKTESKVLQKFGPHENGVTGTALSKDGKLLYTVSDQGRYDSGETLNDLNSSFEDIIAREFSLFPRRITIWNSDSGEKVTDIQAHQGGINALARSIDGQLLVTASDDSTFGILHAAAGKLNLFKAHQGKVLSVAISPDGSLIATTSDDNRLGIWRSDGSNIIWVKDQSLVRAVAFSPDGQWIATGDFDGQIHLYNQKGDSLNTIISKAGRRIESLAFSPDGRFLLSGEWSNTACLFSMKDFSLFAALQINAENKTGGAAIHAVAFSPDSRKIGVGSEGGLAQIFKIFGEKVEPLQTLQHYPKRAILAVQFTPDGKGVLTGSNDHWAWWWKLEN
jgi:WD40 repeat protein